MKLTNKKKKTLVKYIKDINEATKDLIALLESSRLEFEGINEYEAEEFLINEHKELNDENERLAKKLNDCINNF